VEGESARMMVLLWISLGLGFVWIFLFVSALRQAQATPTLKPLDPKRFVQSEARVCALVPARDEEQNIEACLRSLMAQSHERLRILVVDDRSEDATAEVVRRLMREADRLDLLQAPEPPAGWMGKCHALHLGAEHVAGDADWLWFVDADTLHHVDSLSASLGEAERVSADLISLVPHLEGRSFWERLVQPSVAALIAMFHRPSRVNDPKRPEAFANGQFILTRVAAYRAVGGHASVAGKVLEDVELAKCFQESGRRIHLAIGRDLFSTRMYSGLGSLVNGWTKNLYLLVQAGLARAWFAVIFSMVLSTWPAVFGIWAAGAFLTGHRPWPGWALAALLGTYAMVLSFQILLRAFNRWYPAYAPLAPLANLVVAIILLRSAWRHRHGQGVTWKGRKVHNLEGEP